MKRHFYVIDNPRGFYNEREFLAFSTRDAADSYADDHQHARRVNRDTVRNELAELDVMEGGRIAGNCYLTRKASAFFDRDAAQWTAEEWSQHIVGLAAYAVGV